VSACKWITEIELTAFADFDAYWVPRGWSQQAPIKTESRIDTPRTVEPAAGPVDRGRGGVGAALGISKVEVQVDGGRGRGDAGRTVSSDTWRRVVTWHGGDGRQAHASGSAPPTSTAGRRPAPPHPAPDGAQAGTGIQVTLSSAE
jgi:hypothetical protein